MRFLHCSDDNIGIGAAEYHVLESCRPDPSIPLLPHLSGLYWDDFRATVAPFVRLFIQSSLVVLHIISISNPRLIAAFLEDLAIRAPLVKHLRIRSPGASSRGSIVADALSKALLQLRYLTDVAIRAHLTEDHLMQLATLPSLTALCAPLDPDADFARLSSRHRGTLFPALSKVDITARHLSQVTPILRAVSSRNLHKVGVHLEVQPTSYALQDFLHAASAHPCIQELSILMLSARRPDADLKIASSDHLLTDDTVRPLLALHALTRLYMIQLPFQITDGFIRDAATAWPLIESLTLGTMVRSRTSGVTLEGIRPLSQKCRRLRDLAIAVDVPPRKAGGDDATYDMESFLKTFDLGCTPLFDTDRLVHFIIDAFPNAKIIDTQASLDVVRKRLLEKLNNTLARIQDLDAE